MADRGGFAEWLGSVIGDAGRAAAAEFGRAAESVRHEVVDRAWFGRSFPESPVTPASAPPSFEQWAGIEPASTPSGDVLGRTMDTPAEDRPSNLPEREATAAAYARHQEAGPFGLIEIENAHAYEQRGFEQWAGIGPADDRAGEAAHEPPFIEIER